MKMPGPDHPLTITPIRRHVRSAFDGTVIADTEDALLLNEADYPPYYYFPKDDVDMSFFAPTEHRTHCPYKGEASYWSILMHGDIQENVAWAYEDPFPAGEPLKGRICFDPKRVEVYELDEAALHRAPILGGDAGHSTP